MFRIPRIITPLIAMLLFGMSVPAQVDIKGGIKGDKVIQRMYLVGDAGEMADGHHPVCDWLKAHVDWNDTSNVLVYLGDNIYPHGMPAAGAKDYEAARRIIDYQISVVQGRQARPISSRVTMTGGGAGRVDGIRSKINLLISMDCSCRMWRCCRRRAARDRWK